MNRPSHIDSARQLPVLCNAEAGQIMTWGGGEHGQLGHGNRDNQLSPWLVVALKVKTKHSLREFHTNFCPGILMSQDVSIRQISCGWSHTVALAGSILCIPSLLR